MVLLNVVLFAVSGFLGLGFLLQTLRRLSQARDVTEPQPTIAQVPAVASHPQGALDAVPGQRADQSVRAVFRIWVVVFALVGAQMGWVLRPFVGHPNASFAFFRPRKQNFFQAVAEKVQDLFEPTRRGEGGR
jgi:hypothetical protein